MWYVRSTTSIKESSEMSGISGNNIHWKKAIYSQLCTPGWACSLQKAQWIHTEDTHTEPTLLTKVLKDSVSACKLCILQAVSWNSVLRPSTSSSSWLRTAAVASACCWYKVMAVITAHSNYALVSLHTQMTVNIFTLCGNSDFEFDCYILNSSVEWFGYLLASNLPVLLCIYCKMAHTCKCTYFIYVDKSYSAFLLVCLKWPIKENIAVILLFFVAIP